ncbi:MULTISPECIES: McrB family protein [Shewanella]|uniref:McrB family protein n=1 Tax=Shewanella TaxID=22 RepID=UPI001FFC5266|nr:MULTISPECIES: restriction endonuclease [Shewanella]MCU8022291.1 restriction endonuclease [Shewanella sp. SM78]MCU8044751.1 restriction endonuclease [Shewanella sp. SM68]MCU8049037.1 restriction endonuclease [Shewanella sp. SM65]MCU8079582.1 restriction endonuclease [Shewanella sp. SM103]
MLIDLRKYSGNSSYVVVNTNTLKEIKLPANLRDKIEGRILAGKLTVNPYTAFSNTSATNYAVMPNQIFRFACEIYDAAFDVMAYFNVLDEIRTSINLTDLFSENVEEIEAKLLALGLLDEYDVKLLAQFISFPKKKGEKNEYRLGGKSIFNKSDAGKVSVRSNEDCFGSIVLTMVNLPNSSSSIFGDLVYSLVQNKDLYDEIRTYFYTLSNSIPSEQITRLSVEVSKPFLLLAGISGTGKTRFVREQAKATGSLAETYCLTSVRPDWHEPSDLLGYISRLNGAAEYITTDVLQFIAKAWRGIADRGLSIEVQDIEEQGKRLVVTGERDALEQVLPYWLCLDEMNLAPVEQYFADYLSVLETREWRWADDSFTYSSDALLKPTTINDVADKDKLRKELGFGSEEYNELWDIICQYGLGIPFNLMVAGTVNMDETTHGFSRKVIDRALSFDFGEFFPNKTEEFFAPKHKPKALSYPLYSQAKLPMFASVTADCDASKTTAFFNAINAVLKQTPFELAFRAFNELCLAVISFSPKTELELTAVFDDFLMCKVLPRIEGDDDKLVGNSEQNLLEQLETVLADKLANIWQGTRPDLLREVIEQPDETVMVACRSATKLVRMRKLLESGFTSFWP